ncbi:hypothetical protein LTR36_007484 [Oleoguttula mirabilis]|uniref:General stress protein FMN-binding split barrel domain-containing protein n=1 Tax=Oleoguttula mirabilis TaxID=1507867 RepID=A0AAV9JTJ3_9PEZI|nr:hypothetical protein LTR36_007484 [Oleoguttula mirabilis]
MPETLTKQEVEKGQDPSVTKQYDDSVSLDEKFEDIKSSLTTGYEHNGQLTNNQPVARAMAVAKRSGPDFLFLSNRDSQKFDDLESNKVATIYFHNSNNQDWISVTGETAKTSNDDPRIKEIWSQGTRAWFGDLKDGVHTGGPEDPRMKLIEIKAKFISYWKHDVGALGFMGEIGTAIVTGGVANTGTLRQMKEDEIEQARSKHSSMTS